MPFRRPPLHAAYRPTISAAARIGTPDKLAELMVWLLSDSATRVTGQVWSLDGGFSSFRPLVK